MKKVMITGINGFTGRYLATEMADHGWDVWGLGNQENAGQAGYKQAELTRKEELTAAVAAVQPDAVVHLGAVSFVGHSDATAFYRVNLIGTRNLLEALSLCRKPPECIVLASSANIYGNATEGMLSESNPPNPANDYAVSKLAMEYMAHLWMDKLPIVITRPFNYTGVGQSGAFLLPKIVAHFRSKAARIELGNLDIWRDFSDVRAVAQAYRCLVEQRPIGETVNICSGRIHSLRDVLSMVENISGHKICVEINPQFVRANEVKTLCGNASKLRRLIGKWDTPPLYETLDWMLTADDQ